LVFSVIQPAYFPAIPVIGKLLAADKIIWADNLIFNRHSDINRTKIKTITGPKWLTIPVLSGDHTAKTIRCTQIDNHEIWAKKHRRSIYLNYKNAAYYYYYCDELERLLQKQWNNLTDLLWAGMEFIINSLRAKNQIIKSSELAVVEDRSERVITWAEQLNCETYLVHDFEKKLIDINKINKAGINVLTFNLEKFNYFQQYEGFIYPLSVLDILLNEGDNTSRMIKEQVLLKQG